MATTLRVQVSLPSTNQIPRDAAVNTWHFGSGAVDPVTDAGLISVALEDFYNEVEGIFSVWLSGTANVKVYNLLDAEPRSPIYTDVFTFTPQSGTALPPEVAICLSYNAALASGTPPGRRRGRIYLGPLDADVVDNGLTGPCVDAGRTSAIAGAAGNLVTAGAASTWDWAVFSPTSAGSPPWTLAELVAGTFTVTHAHVDDAFDTVRSRGIAAEARAVWP